MTQKQVNILTLMGIETLLKGEALLALGHTTTDGHCCYIKDSSESLIDNILLHLSTGGDKTDELCDLYSSAEIRLLLLECSRLAHPELQNIIRNQQGDNKCTIHSA